VKFLYGVGSGYVFGHVASLLTPDPITGIWIFGAFLMLYCRVAFRKEIEG